MRPAQVDSDWQLQSGSSEQVLSGGYRVQLRFVEHAQWQQIRALLLELDAVLVELGPFLEHLLAKEASRARA